MPPSEQQVATAVALVEAQSQARQQIVDLTTQAVVAQVRAFAGWYDSPAITTFAGRLAKLTRASQKRTAASTDAYAVRLLRLLGANVRAKGPVPAESLRAVPLESVYGRLADQHRWLEATRGPNAPVEALQRRNDQGILIDPFPRLTQEQITQRVVARARVQVEDNLGLAMTHQWRDVLEDAPGTVTSYRRVIHPELSQSGTCGLCLAAATREYRKAELMPLHPGCHCQPVPVVGDVDLGFQLNAADFKVIYGRAGTSAEKLRATRYQVVEHSELGPRLTYLGHNTRTAKQALEDDKIPSAA